MRLCHVGFEYCFAPQKMITCLCHPRCQMQRRRRRVEHKTAGECPMGNDAVLVWKGWIVQQRLPQCELARKMIERRPFMGPSTKIKVRNKAVICSGVLSRKLSRVSR